MSFAYWFNSAPNSSTIVLVGDKGVGKTSLRQRYLYNTFQSHLNLNNNMDLFESRILQSKNRKYLLNFWDSPGAYLKDFMIPYLNQVEGVILTYDVTNRQSFENIPFWIKTVNQKNKNIVKIIAGTKADLQQKRAVSLSQGFEMAKKFNCEHIETSSRDAVNVEKLFQILGITICKKSHNKINQGE